MYKNILEKIKMILKEELNIIISTIDDELYPSIRTLENIHQVNNSFYLYLKNDDPILKDIKKNNKVLIYIKNNNIELRLKSEIKILGKSKKKGFIENNSKDNKLEIVKLKKVVGEITYLDTSTKEEFSLKKSIETNNKYQINSKCKTCNKCYKACPVDAIEKGKKKYKIDPLKCINCGKCYKVCPHNAIDKL